MSRILFSLPLALALFSCATYNQSGSLAGMPADAPVVTIAMTAEDFKFTPDRVTVKRGSHVVIELTSLDVGHEIYIKDLGVRVSVPAKGKAKAEFFASTPGTYAFTCPVGFGYHASHGMKGELVVE